jgi:nitrate reductase gamma subunit
VHGIGYAATLGLVGATIVMLHGRLRPSAPIHRHSHESDWIFLGLLLFVALTGVAQHVLHRSGAEVAANLMYVVHLMGAVPMLVVEVPFGKWAHMAYRPLAMYFAALHADALVHAKASTERPAARAA